MLSGTLNSGGLSIVCHIKTVFTLVVRYSDCRQTCLNMTVYFIYFSLSISLLRCRTSCPLAFLLRIRFIDLLSLSTISLRSLSYNVGPHSIYNVCWYNWFCPPSSSTISFIVDNGISLQPIYNDLIGYAVPQPSMSYGVDLAFCYFASIITLSPIVPDCYSLLLAIIIMLSLLQVAYFLPLCMHRVFWLLRYHYRILWL